MQDPSTLALEAHELRRAEQLARSGNPYALILRSFAAETAGLGEYDGHLTHEAFEEQYAMDLGGSLPPRRDYSGLWTLQGSIVHAVAKRFPPVQLGDHPSLGRGLITNALLDNDSIRIRIASDAWWPAFELLVQGAAIVVALIDRPSPSLVKEVDYLRARKIKFVCLQKQDAQEPLCEGAIGYRDYDSFDLPAFERILDDTLSS